MFVAALGGCVVLWGLWLEWKSEKDDWYPNIEEYRKRRKMLKCGEMLVMWGIVIEVFVASTFAALDVREKHALNAKESKDAEITRRSDNFLFLRSRGRRWIIEQPLNGTNDPRQRFEEDLSKMPRGSARILYIENDPEAEIFAHSLYLILDNVGWKVFGPQSIPDSRINGIFGSSIGYGGGVGLIAPIGTDMETKDFNALLKMKPPFLFTNIFELFKTNTPFCALNAAFADCGFKCNLVGYSAETNGIVEIMIGKKNW